MANQKHVLETIRRLGCTPRYITRTTHYDNGGDYALTRWEVRFVANEMPSFGYTCEADDTHELIREIERQRAAYRP
jgi:hypothetical protein